MTIYLVIWQGLDDSYVIEGAFFSKEEAEALKATFPESTQFDISVDEVNVR